MGNPRITPGPEMHAEIRKLLKLWDGRTEKRSHFHEEIDIAAAIMIEVLTHHTARLSKAVLLQVESGFDVEVMPQIRLSIECGMTATWLALREHAGMSLSYEGARQRRAVLANLISLREGFEIAHERAEDILRDLESSKTSEGRAFEQRCKALSGGDEVYYLYRVASSLSHAGAGLGDFYAETTKETESGIFLRSDARLDNIETWVAVQGVMLHRCLLAVNSSNALFKRTTQLNHFAKRLGVTSEVGELRTNK